jgi:hypothetical protein
MSVYGKEVVMSLKFIILSLRIVVDTNMIDEQSLQQILYELMELAEYHLVEGFNQVVEAETKGMARSQHPLQNCAVKISSIVI